MKDLSDLSQVLSSLCPAAAQPSQINIPIKEEVDSPKQRLDEDARLCLQKSGDTSQDSYVRLLHAYARDDSKGQTAEEDGGETFWSVRHC